MRVERYRPPATSTQFPLLDLGPVSTPIQAIFGAVVEVRFGQFRLNTPARGKLSEGVGSSGSAVRALVEPRLS